MSNAWQENQNLKKYVRVGESQFKGKKKLQIYQKRSQTVNQLKKKSKDYKWLPR